MKTQSTHIPMIRLLSVWLLLLAGTTLFAQNRKDNIESFKISFLTQKLNLMPEEARVFWPVYNQYQSEIDAVREERKKARKNAKEDFSTMSDADLEKLVDGEMAFKQTEIDIQKKYHSQFKKILPIKKVALLYKAEEEFKKELLKKLQEQKGN